MSRREDGHPPNEFSDDEVTSTLHGRHGYYAVGLLTAVYACQHLDRQLAGILAGPIGAEFGLSDSELGFLLGFAFTIPYALCVLPAGFVADRVHRSRLLAAAILAWSIFTSASGLARNYFQLVVTRIVVGSLESPGVPVATSLLSEYFARGRRATALGIYYTGLGAGILLGFALGGLIAEHYDWRAAFLLAGVPGAILAFLVWFTLAEPRAARSDERKGRMVAPSIRQTVAFVSSKGSLLHLMTGITLVAISTSAHLAWVAPFLQREHQLPLGMIGVIVGTIFGLCSALGHALGGIIADYLSRFSTLWIGRVAAVGGAAAGVLMILGTIVSDPMAAAVLLSVWLLPYGILFGAVVGTIPSLITSGMRGTVSAFLQLLLNLVGAGIGPQLVGLLSDTLRPSVGENSLAWALAMVSLFIFWGSVHFLIANRDVAGDLRDAERAEIDSGFVVR